MSGISGARRNAGVCSRQITYVWQMHSCTTSSCVVAMEDVIAQIVHALLTNEHLIECSELPMVLQVIFIFCFFFLLFPWQLHFLYFFSSD